MGKKEKVLAYLNSELEAICEARTRAANNHDIFTEIESAALYKRIEAINNEIVSIYSEPKTKYKHSRKEIIEKLYARQVSADKKLYAHKGFMPNLVTQILYAQSRQLEDIIKMLEEKDE